MKSLTTEIREKMALPDTITDEEILEKTEGTLFMELMEFDRSCLIFRNEVRKVFKESAEKINWLFF